MIHYRNYLCTPSGHDCYLNQITNEDYFVLLKYTAAQDYQGFYDALDELIKESIPDFDTFNIVDKMYVYIANCLYSVHNSIITKQTPLGDETLSLGSILNSIEAAYNKLDTIQRVTLEDGCEIEVSLPTELIFGHDFISIDWGTGLKKIKSYTVENVEDQHRIMSSIDTKLALFIEHAIKKSFSVECEVFDDFLVDICREDGFYLIFQLYSENLENYYQLLYYFFEYLKWGYETYAKFTPLESRIIFNFFKEDKEREAKRQMEELNR